MKDNSRSCDPVLVSRFFDKELGADEYARAARHIRDCPSCQRQLKELGTISGKFSTHFTQISQTGSPSIKENVLSAVRKKELPYWIKARDTLFSKRFLIPASVAASVAIIFLATFRPPAVSGPSAIVTSLSGAGSSIIVMETPRTRQTILWFDERG